MSATNLLTCFLRRRLDRGVQEQLSYGTTDGNPIGPSRLSPTALIRVPRLKATTGNHDRDLSGVTGGDDRGGKATEPPHRTIRTALGPRGAGQVQLNGLATVARANVRHGHVEFEVAFRGPA